MTRQQRIDEATDMFYGYIIISRIGAHVRIFGKDYFFSGYKLLDEEEAPDEARDCPFILRDWYYNEFPEKRGKFVRGFKDEFDMMENFKINGKCLRKLIEDGDVELVEPDT